MVAASPNLTRLAGRVTRCCLSESFAGWLQVDLALDAVDPVPGLRSLVRAQPGDVVPVAVAPGLLPADPVGSHLDCRVAVTPNGLRCEPHPAPEHFAVRLN